MFWSYPSHFPFHLSPHPRTVPPTCPTTYPPSKLYVRSTWLSLVSAVHMCMEVGILWNMDKEGFFTYNLRSKLTLASAVFMIFAEYGCHIREIIYFSWVIMKLFFFQSEEEGGKGVQLGWGEEMKGIWDQSGISFNSSHFVTKMKFSHY